MAIAVAAAFTAIGGIIAALIARLPLFKKNLVKKVDLGQILLDERRQFAREQETLIQFITSQLAACEQKSSILQQTVWENQKQMHEQQLQILDLITQIKKLQNP